MLGSGSKPRVGSKPGVTQAALMNTGLRRPPRTDIEGGDCVPPRVPLTPRFPRELRFSRGKRGRTSTPYGSRTRVFGLRTRCPGPLDEGGNQQQTTAEQSIFGRQYLTPLCFQTRARLSTRGTRRICNPRSKYPVCVDSTAGKGASGKSPAPSKMTPSHVRPPKLFGTPRNVRVTRSWIGQRR